MITARDAANVLNYLLAAQAVTVVDGAAAVWADYVSTEAPEVKPDDLAPATRQAIRDWSDGGRAWKIDPQALVRAARRVRGDRITAAGQLPIPPIDLPPGIDMKWFRRVRELVGDGKPIKEAIVTACRELNIPPDKLIDSKPHTPGRPSRRPSSSQEEK